jgi:hypothetical protein
MGKLFILKRKHFSSRENYLSRRDITYPKRKNISQEGYIFNPY